MSGSAVLLVNLGSPASTAVTDVRRYLDEFLMDPYVLDVPAPLRALIVRGLILPTRPAATAAAYAKIWTAAGSPLVAITERVRSALEVELELPVGMAMRYGSPAIGAAIDGLLARAPDAAEIVVVPLYPHYAMASTKTAVEAVGRALRARNVPHRFVGPFYDHPAYLDALADGIAATGADDDVYLLFSYHGIPARHVRKSDPTSQQHCRIDAVCCAKPSRAHATCYRHQVIDTTERVAARLGRRPGTYGLAFQSRLGRGWLEPFTDRELAALPGRGVRRLAVVCPSFVADCLETLEEMALRGRETFLAAGGTGFAYVPCLNDAPRWIAALATICRTPVPMPA